jgi:hypothetical protein
LAVDDVDSARDDSDLSDSFAHAIKQVSTEEAILQKTEHPETHPLTSTVCGSSTPAHSKIASAILDSTITMAANVVQNSAVHQDIRTVGKIVIVIIEKFKVSGFSRARSLFLLSLSYLCLS